MGLRPSFLPLGPIVIPLFFGIVLALCPVGWRKPSLLRGTTLLALFLTGLTLGLLLFIPERTKWVASWDLSRGIAFAPQKGEFSLGLLLIGLLFLFELASWGASVSPKRQAALLWLLGATVAASMAWNSVSFCLAWGVADLAFLGIEAVQFPERGAPWRARRAWGRMASTSLAVVGSALLWGASEPEMARLPVLLLALAALLRMGLYPLPGAGGTGALPVFSLGLGGGLWLGVASLGLLHLPRQWVLALGGAFILLMGLLVALSPRWEDALPWLYQQGLGLLVLLPLLAPEEVKGLAPLFFLFLVGGWGLAWAGRMLAAREQEDRFPWGGLLAFLGVASLSGWPLTTGMVARWALLHASAKGIGSKELFLWMALGGLFAQTAGWPIFLQVKKALLALPTWGQVRKELRVPQLVSLLVGLCFLLFGLHPPLFGQLFQSLSWKRLLAAQRGEELLLLAVVLVPHVGSYYLWRYFLRTRPRHRGRRGFALEGLYGVVQYLWERGQYLGGRLLLALEERLILGWTLLWALAVILYFLHE
ncbi:MAG: hypothetical protein J7M05_08540 [Anaerolineae bacterium]|nr:hypothetical protein [Anaerolineae bacterium]